MEGITKAALLGVAPWLFDDQQDLLNAILEACTELDPWIPITPDTHAPGRVMLLYPDLPATPRQCSGEYDILNARYVADQVIQPSIQPTHYRLLKD